MEKSFSMLFESNLQSCVCVCEEALPIVSVQSYFGPWLFCQIIRFSRKPGFHEQADDRRLKVSEPKEAVEYVVEDDSSRLSN